MIPTVCMSSPCVCPLVCVSLRVYFSFVFSSVYISPPCICPSALPCVCLLRVCPFVCVPLCVCPSVCPLRVYVSSVFVFLCVYFSFVCPSVCMSLVYICSEPFARQAQTLEWAWPMYSPKNLVNGNEAHSLDEWSRFGSAASLDSASYVRRSTATPNDIFNEWMIATMYIFFLTPTTFSSLPTSCSETLQRFKNVCVFEAFNLKVLLVYQFIRKFTKSYPNIAIFYLNIPHLTESYPPHHFFEPLFNVLHVIPLATDSPPRLAVPPIINTDSSGTPHRKHTCNLTVI